MGGSNRGNLDKAKGERGRRGDGGKKYGEMKWTSLSPRTCMKTRMVGLYFVYNHRNEKLCSICII